MNLCSAVSELRVFGGERFPGFLSNPKEQRCVDLSVIPSDDRQDDLPNAGRLATALQTWLWKESQLFLSSFF